MMTVAGLPHDGLFMGYLGRFMMAIFRHYHASGVVWFYFLKSVLCSEIVQIGNLCL